jgi:hypothetical protein
MFGPRDQAVHPLTSELSTKTVWWLADESSGTFYALGSDVVDLDPYVGQRVTVYGTLVPGYESGGIEGGPPLVEVTEVVPADAPAGTTSFDFFGYEPALF